MNKDNLSDETCVVLIVNRYQCSKDLAEKLLISSKLNNSFENLKNSLINDLKNNKNKKENKKNEGINE